MILMQKRGYTKMLQPYNFSITKIRRKKLSRDRVRADDNTVDVGLECLEFVRRVCKGVLVARSHKKNEMVNKFV